MKNNTLFIFTAITIMLSSCIPSAYYQLYKATPLDKAINNDSNEIVYEDDNCKVYYNFWNEGGNMGFRFFNKTNDNLYLILKESFFIVNDHSFDYYLNRNITFGLKSTISSGILSSKSINNYTYLTSYNTNSSNLLNTGTTSEYSITYNEKEIVCIPSHTFKIIFEYKITNSLYRDCDLFKYPNNKKKINTKSFTKENEI